LRAIDPSYLTNDFTVNATSGYEPRFYYTRLIALLGHVAPLPVVCFVLTVLQNAAMAAVTVVVGRRLFKSDDAALAGAVLVLSVTATDLGEDGFLLSSCLLPATLVTPLVLLALWQGVENRPVVCAALAAVAALVHPLIGLALGAIGLATSLLSVLFRISPEGGPAYTARSLFPSLLSGLGFALFAYGVWLWRQHQILSNRQFVDLYGWLRCPHHIIPSQFKPQDYDSFALLFAAAGASWVWW
jgi:hypothetical protein